MRMILLGIGVILLSYGWLTLNAYVGYTNAWWYFRWSEFKPIWGACHFAGVFLIGLGIVQAIKRRRNKAGK